MKYTRIIATHYGGPGVLRIVEEECPEPGRGELRVKVLAAGVSFPDVFAREGIHPQTPDPPPMFTALSDDDIDFVVQAFGQVRAELL